MIGTFKIDKSFFGHILEAQLIAVVMAIALSPWFALWPAYLLGGALGVAFYVGREKRDTETGLDLTSGSPKAWYLMWIRWSNLTDVAGPILAYAAVWAAYLLG